MVDLTSTYMGIKLKNPVIASASPLSQKVQTAQQLEAEGVSAITMYSLFEEQIQQESLKLDRDLERGAEAFAEAIDYFPKTGQYSIGPEKYLQNLSNLKRNLHIPVIGSLNGHTLGGWVEYAKKIEDAGADALELNIYDVPTDPYRSGTDLEKEYLRLVRRIRESIHIPVAVKLSPFFTSLPHFAKQLTEAGVNGLVLFNRFYQPDFDLENLEVIPHLVLSTSHELRLPLRYIAILYGRIPVDFGLTSGVHCGEDVIKAIMAGASVVAIASEFLAKGPQRAREILQEITTWMESHEYLSIQQMRGSMSQQAVADPGVIERANYMQVLSSY